MIHDKHRYLCPLGRRGDGPHLRKQRRGCTEEGPAQPISLSFVTFYHGLYHSQGSFPKTWASVVLPFCLETSKIRVKMHNFPNGPVAKTPLSQCR